MSSLIYSPAPPPSQRVLGVCPVCGATCEVTALEEAVIKETS